MATRYSDELAAWIKQRKSTRREKNLVAFLAVRDDVKQAIEEGYAITTIWENLHEGKRIAFCYNTFLTYINRHIRHSVATPTNPVPDQLPALAVGRQSTGLNG
ncbi:TraK family protein, partial [Massilia glaciei]|uniref:TraK family protein n=1 Tax=Massilia glaciei TaxID=1524097 RepID=UPI000D64B073